MTVHIKIEEACKDITGLLHSIDMRFACKKDRKFKANRILPRTLSKNGYKFSDLVIIKI